MTQEQYEQACLLQKRIKHAQNSIERLKDTNPNIPPSADIIVFSSGQKLTEHNELFGKNVFFQALLDFYISQRDKAQEEFEAL
jgi:hypothetical protein